MERKTHVPLPAHKHEWRKDLAWLSTRLDVRQQLENGEKKLVRYAEGHGCGQRAREGRSA
jgi:hypothetical protein